MNVRPIPLDRIPAHVVALHDYEALARERLDDNAWTYLASGAGDELTMRWNREAFNETRLTQRVLAAFSGGHTGVQLLGLSLPHPVILAPVAYQKLFHPQGEGASARAAAVMGAVFVAATLASTTLEEIASASEGAPQWFQLYVQQDRARTLDLVRRTEAAGYRGLMVTVDAPVNGVRNAEQRIGFRLPPGVVAANLQGGVHAQSPSPVCDGHPIFDGLLAHAPTWADLQWLRSVTKLPLIVKGILSPQDAKQAIACGADALVVSNHGGRTLDTLEASLSALPHIKAAVGDSVPLLLDSGVKRGTDVLKAMALGASAVMIGRPYAMALAAAGALGVAHALRLLVEEFTVAMALSGCAHPGAIDVSVLSRRATLP